MSGFNHHIHHSAPKSLDIFGPDVVDYSRLREKPVVIDDEKAGELSLDDEFLDMGSLSEIEGYGAYNNLGNKDDVVLNVLHTNDFHGNLLPSEKAGDDNYTTPKESGGAARASAIIQKERELSESRNEKFLLVDSGDMSMGTPISGFFKGIPVIDVMNRQKYDAATIGNHEFDWGLGPLKDMVSTARFPFVCANVKDAGGKPLLGLKPYVIKDLGSVKVGIIGLATDETPQITSNDETKKLQFENPAETLRSQIPLMKEEGADVVMVLSHLGLAADEEIASKVDGIDLIVGGHSHTAMKSHRTVGSTVIVQAGANGENIGRVSLKWSPASKSVTAVESRLIPVDDKITPDGVISGIVSRYRIQVDAMMNRKLGELAEDLYPPSEGNESSLGNLVTDMMRKTTGAPVALLNSGNIRSGLNRGEVLFKDLYKVIPFDSKIVKVKMKGNDLLKILEDSAGREKDKKLQVSGLSIRYDSTRPRGHRLMDVKLEDGSPIDTEKYYTVATTDYLVRGGDNYDTFRDNSSDIEEGEVLQKEVAENLKAEGILSCPPMGRISDTGFNS